MLRFNYKEYEYEIYPFKVKYTNTIIDPTGSVIEQYALPNKGWWYETAKKHPAKINILEINKIQITQDMQERFESIKNFDAYDLAVKYIEGEELTQNQVDFILGKTDTLDEASNR